MILKGFIRQGGNSGNHSNCDRKPFKSFKQESNMLQFIFFSNSFFKESHCSRENKLRNKSGGVGSGGKKDN